MVDANGRSGHDWFMHWTRWMWWMQWIRWIDQPWVVIRIKHSRRRRAPNGGWACPPALSPNTTQICPSAPFALPPTHPHETDGGVGRGLVGMRVSFSCLR